MHRLFIYGTLLDSNLLRQMLGRSVVQQKAQLHGFARCKVRQNGRHFPNLYRRQNSVVYGSVILVSEKELAVLDEYEGSPYVRTTEVLSDQTPAWVYWAST